VDSLYYFRSGALVSLFLHSQIPILFDFTDVLDIRFLKIGRYDRVAYRRIYPEGELSPIKPTITCSRSPFLSFLLRFRQQPVSPPLHHCTPSSSPTALGPQWSRLGTTINSVCTHSFEAPIFFFSLNKSIRKTTHSLRSLRSLGQVTK
jgi:hypothetical protein